MKQIRQAVNIPVCTIVGDIRDPEPELLESLRVLMFDKLFETRSGSITAPQAGFDYNAIAVGYSPEHSVFAFNPRIVDRSDKLVLGTEQCASIPGITLKVKRPDWIRVRYQQVDGETVTVVFGGLTARLFEHAVDALTGVSMLDRANRYHIEQAFKKANK